MDRKVGFARENLKVIGMEWDRGSEEICVVN